MVKAVKPSAMNKGIEMTSKDDYALRSNHGKDEMASIESQNREDF